VVAVCATKAGDRIEIVEAGEGDVEGLARGRRLPIGGEVDGQIFPGPRLALACSSVAAECGRMAIQVPRAAIAHLPGGFTVFSLASCCP
jgi:hypothetical protein